MNQQTRQAILKFKLASDFHKHIRGNKDKDDYGRTLTFLHFNRRDQLEITWKDLELIGALLDDKETDALPL